MNELSCRELSHIANHEARRQYPALVRLLGITGLAAARPTRLGLRVGTPYPYSFTETDDFYPDAVADSGFGRIIRANRDEGLREIHSSIETQQKEHGWMYLEEAQLWIDTSLAADAESVDADQYIQTFLSHHFAALENVHTHPDPVIVALANEKFGRFSDNYLTEAALPSNGDLMRSVMLEKRGSATATVVDSVVSHYGVTSYTMQDHVRRAGILTSSFRQAPITELMPDPVSTIRHAFGKIVAHGVLETDTLTDVDLNAKVPIFDFRFEPLSNTLRA